MRAKNAEGISSVNRGDGPTRICSKAFGFVCFVYFVVNPSELLLLRPFRKNPICP